VFFVVNFWSRLPYRLENVSLLGFILQVITAKLWYCGT
jgi:hypothetical protein